MVRDFIVVGDGWVKDGDYNTTFSRTVLPLPTHASGRYDHGAAHARRRPGLPAACRRLRDVPHAVRHPRRPRRAARGRTTPGPMRRYARPLPRPAVRDVARHAVADPPLRPSRHGGRGHDRPAGPLWLSPDRVFHGRGPGLRPRRSDAGREAGAHHAAGGIDGRGGVRRGRRRRRPRRPVRDRQQGRVAQSPVSQPRRRHVRGHRGSARHRRAQRGRRPVCRWDRRGATTTTTASPTCCSTAGGARNCSTTTAAGPSRA